MFASPGIDPKGLAWDGSHLWVSDNSDDMLYRMTIAGDVVAATSAPGSSPWGLTFDGLDLWVLDDADDRLYQIDISGYSVPEPSILLLCCPALAGLLVMRRRPGVGVT